MGLFQTIKEKLGLQEKSLSQITTSVSNKETKSQVTSVSNKETNKEENDLLSKIHNADFSNLDNVFNLLEEHENKKKEKELLVMKQQEEIQYKISLYDNFIKEVKETKDDTLKEKMLDNYLNNLSDNDFDIFYNEYFLNKEGDLFDFYYIFKYRENQIEKVKEKLIPSYLQTKMQKSDIDNLYEKIKDFEKYEYVIKEQQQYILPF